MDINIIFLFKIILTMLAITAFCVIAGMSLASGITTIAFPETTITVLGDVLPFHAIINNIILGKDGACSQILSIKINRFRS